MPRQLRGAWWRRRFELVLASARCGETAIAQTNQRIGVACLPPGGNASCFECSKSSGSHCASTSDWAGVNLNTGETNSPNVELRFEGQQARVAYVDSTFHVRLLWSDGSNTQAGSWQVTSFIDVDVGVVKGITLEIGASGRTAIAFRLFNYDGLWALTCSGGCFTQNKTWGWVRLDDDALAYSEGFTLPPSNCKSNEQPLAYSTTGDRPRLEAAGNKFAVVSIASDGMACFRQLGVQSFYRPRYFEF